MLFLTDGEDTSDVAVEEIVKMNDKAQFTIFTYSFGQDADGEKPREIACQNRGIWYQVPDGGDIADVMAEYYAYYAEKLAESSVVRFSDFEDAVTGTRLSHIAGFRACRLVFSLISGF